MAGHEVGAHPDPVAGRKRSRRLDVGPPGRARRSQRKRAAGALLELLAREQALLDAERREAGERALVVAGREVVARLHALDRVPVLVHVEDAEPHRQRVQRVGAQLPTRRERPARRAHAAPARSPACRRGRACRPCASPSRRATPIIASRLTRPRQRRPRLQPSGAVGPHRQHHVARVGRRVPDADLDLGRQVEAHLPQHGARLPHDAGAVLQVLVPVGRQADDRERGARAERAADDVLHRRRVLEHHQMPVVARHRQAQLGDRGAAVGEQAGAKRRVGPGAGDDARAVLRQPFLLREVLQLGDDVVRRHAALARGGLDGGEALLDRCSAFCDAAGRGPCLAP